MVHVKKIHTSYFKDILLNNKRFEIREDEGYSIGDCVILEQLNEFKDKTGRYLVTEITYVLRDVPYYGLKEGYCIFGFDIVAISKF